MAGWKTLVYSPEARIYIEDVDVSRDIVRGVVSRIVDGASHLEVTLSNKGGRYSNRFRRMDRITCWLTRIEPFRVFSGYLDSVPVLQMHPDFVTLKATCTIKRIIYTLWDPGLPASQILLDQQRVPWGTDGVDGGQAAGQNPADDPGGLVDDITGQNPPSTATDAPADSLEDLLQPGLPDEPADNNVAPDDPADAPGSNIPGAPNRQVPLWNDTDSGLGSLLREVLVEVGGWDPEDIKIQKFPKSFIGYVEEKMPEIQTLYGDAEKAFKELFQYDEPGTTGAAGGAGGGGGLSNATFTTIGPPANGTAYNDDELIWIVKNAGWRGDDIPIGASIIKAESGGRPGASNLNSNGTYDRGLWQINDVHNDKLPGQNRMDPAVSTQLARMIYSESGGWTPWSTYSYNGTYSQHMDAMRAAAARGGTAPPNSGSTGPIQGPGIPGNPGTPTSGPGTTPPTQGGQPDPNAPNTSGMSINDAMIAVVKYKFPGPPWPDQGMGNAGRFAVGSRERYTDDGYHSQGKAVDFAQGTSDTTPDMQELARWWKQNYMGKGILELIHVGPNNVYNDQDAGDGISIYTAGTMGDHRDHVHIAMNTVVNADGTTQPGTGGPMPGGAAGGGGSSQPAFQNRLAKNLFTYMFKPSTYNDKMSTLLTGKFATLNDVSLMTTVKALCEAGLRSFQSAPDGTFLAFYPDYWGIDGTAPTLRLEDVETINFRIDANDDAMVTHVFTRGANGIMGTFNDTSDLGFLQSSGIVTVEDKWLFDRATEGFYYPPEFSTAEEMLRRFGPRKIKEDYPNIYMGAHPEAMLLVAIKLFMKKWAQQFQTRVEFTFMPELFPGMRIEMAGADLAVYVESVVHTFDYQAGFRTSAQVMAPMRLSKQPRNDRPEGPATPQAGGQ